jgi:uncharacterized protein
MALFFEWDTAKARANEVSHGISFEEAASVFGDPLSLTIADPLHSLQEERFITIGESARGRVIVVVHTDRKSRIRIISSRKATRRERRDYEESQ